MIFKGFQKTSMIEFPGKIVSVVFTPGCNFRCPFCHNRDLILNHLDIVDIPEEEIMNYLKSKRMWIDGIAITGGEPTMFSELPAFIKRVKDEGFVVQLETNGTNPKMVEQLLKDKLLDYIAMDIKAPLEEEKYYKVIGEYGNKKEVLKNVKESISLIRNSGIGYEFRTTFAPEILTKEDIIQIGKQLKGAKRFSLQKFRPNNTLDPEFLSKEGASAKELNLLKPELEEFFDEVVIKA